MNEAAIKTINDTSLSNGCIVRQRWSHWELRCGQSLVEIPTETSQASIAQALRALKETVRDVSARCVLALHSNECYGVDAAIPEGVDGRDRTAIRYELERLLPIDAEEFTCDYHVTGDRKQIFAIAIETRRWSVLVDALGAEGFEVVAIVPESLLITQSIITLPELQFPIRIGIVQSDGCFETIDVDADKLVIRWKSYSSVELWKRCSDFDSERDRGWVIVGRHQAMTTLANAKSISRPPSHLIGHAVQLACEGKLAPSLNLRCGDLAPEDSLHAIRTPLRWLGLSAVICLLAVWAGSWYRGSRYERELAAIDQQQRQAFKDAFPRQRVPVLLMRTVRNEHARAIGSRGIQSVNLPISAAAVLRDLFDSLERAGERDARFRVLEMQINDGECSLTVRAASAIQIGILASEMENVGFQVTPPASEQIPPNQQEPIETYQSTLKAEWISPANRVDNLQATTNRSSDRERSGGDR
ncbi:type II secretion system protein GspL [Roseiconus lacunae]|uniref:type II secretion system protein GspL n=1 Tax=Roseiconus lacunae TaxID=2605694 RepID=UPI001E3A941F|nr:type II secretion system protein GspL [Roseiconus lacunae]MCD0458792.1 type II secretion system protein GspL [Roseiconus lacunae]